MDATLQDRLDQYAAQTRDWVGGGVLSFWVGDLDGAVRAHTAADEVHYAASTMKLPLLVAAYRQAERGLLDLDAEVPVVNRFASAADGSAYALDRADDQDDETWDLQGRSVTLRHLAEHATIYSGNLATNLLLAAVGLDAVAEALRDAGCSPATVVARGIEDAAAREAGLHNLVTAADLGRLMRAIADRSIAEPDTCAAIEAVLARQHWREGIPAALPKDTYVANKTGWVTGLSHDVALVRPADFAAYVLVVLCTLDLGGDELDAVIAAASRVVWEALA